MGRAAFTHDGPGTSAAQWRARPELRDLALVDLAPYQRLVVVAAHPDDESLGAGGLLAEAAASLEVTLVLATAGERSHPRSPTHSTEDLARRRRAEAEAALAILAPAARLVFVGAPDGAVAAAEDALTAALVEQIGEAGSGTLLVAPWREDGHPDHEAAGRAAAAAARRTDADLWEYPVWWWHWSRPEDAPWPALRRLPLSPEARERRDRAVAAHHSQVRPLSDEPGDEVLLTSAMLAHFEGPEELFVAGPCDDTRLERLHREVADPWGVDSRWYEERKRELVLATLPRRTFDRILDLGCSTGALTAGLAGRLAPGGRLTALDASPTAVEAARRRLAEPIRDGLVEVRVASLPDDWPDERPGEWPGDRPESPGAADLVVISEVAYFLSPAGLRQLAANVERALRSDGVVVLCHWRHPVAGWPLDGPRAHALLCEQIARPPQGRYVDRDVEIVVLAPDDVWPEADR